MARSILLAVLILLVGTILYAGTHQTLLTYVSQSITKQTAPLCKNCNVILISLDTVSALHLPCYGYDRNTAPALCAFAKKHVWFTNSYAQSYWTLSSHFSIFTSLYPSTHKVLTPLIDSLDPSHLTLAQVLQNKGYSTLYFGARESQTLPLDKGIGRGFDYINPNEPPNDPGSLPSYWNKAIKMLKNNQRQGKPTFLFLHTYYVHDPYLPKTRNLHFTKDVIPDIPVTQDEFTTLTPDLITYIKNQMADIPVQAVSVLQNYVSAHPLNNDEQSAMLSTYQKFLTTNDYPTEAQLYSKLLDNDWSDFTMPIETYYYQRNKKDAKKEAYIKSLYDERIWQLDEQLQTFIQSITPLLTKNTILIITADHGEAFAEHGKVFHTTLYNEVLRVPLVISIPHVPARAIQTPVEGIDLYPTILRFLGFSPMSPIEGADLTGIILGLPLAQGKSSIISEMFNDDPGVKTAKTIIDAKWKLYVKNIEDPSKPNNIELYDTQNDIWDRRNVSSQYPGVVRVMFKKFQQFIATHSVVFPNPSPKTLEQIQEEVRKLKYFHY